MHLDHTLSRIENWLERPNVRIIGLRNFLVVVNIAAMDSKQIQSFSFHGLFLFIIEQLVSSYCCFYTSMTNSYGPLIKDLIFFFFEMREGSTPNGAPNRI